MTPSTELDKVYAYIEALENQQAEAANIIRSSIQSYESKHNPILCLAYFMKMNTAFSTLKLDPATVDIYTPYLEFQKHDETPIEATYVFCALRRDLSGLKFFDSITNIRDETKEDAILCTTATGSVDVIKYLYSTKLNICKNSHTILHECTNGGHPELLRFLLNLEVYDLSKDTTLLLTIFHKSVQFHHYHMIDYLLELFEKNSIYHTYQLSPSHIQYREVEQRLLKNANPMVHYAFELRPFVNKKAVMQNAFVELCCSAPDCPTEILQLLCMHICDVTTGISGSYQAFSLKYPPRIIDYNSEIPAYRKAPAVRHRLELLEANQNPTHDIFA